MGIRGSEMEGRSVSRNGLREEGCSPTKKNALCLVRISLCARDGAHSWCKERGADAIEGPGGRAGIANLAN